MRLTIDILIAVMLTTVLVVVIVIQHDRHQTEKDRAQTQAALHLLQEKTAYHTALESAMLGGQDTMIVHIDEAWFGKDRPDNALVSDDRPWIDLAPPGDLGLHPPDPVATREDQAAFWYNPTTGVFRARVSPGSSEGQTLALYNTVNGSALERFEQMPDPTRRPIAHLPGKAPAKQYASMANQTWSKPRVEVKQDPEPTNEPARVEALFDAPPAPLPAPTQGNTDAPMAPQASDQTPKTDADAADDRDAPAAAEQADRPSLKPKRGSNRPTLDR